MNQIRSRTTSPLSAANTPELAGDRGQHQHRGVERRERDVEQLGLGRPQSGLTERIVKYIANSAAKNISSEDSHTIVPTAACSVGWRGRESAERRCAAAVATAALLRSRAGAAPLTPRPGSAVSRRTLGACCDASAPGPTPGPATDLPPADGLGGCSRQWSSRSLPLLGVCLVGGLYLYGVHRLRARGDPWPRRPDPVSSSGSGWGSFLLATTLRAGRLRHHAVLGPHGPAHDAGDAGADLPGAGRPDHAGAADAAAAGDGGVLLAVLHCRVAEVLTFPVVAGALFVDQPVRPVLLRLVRGDPAQPACCTTSTTCTSSLVGLPVVRPLLGRRPAAARVPATRSG